MSVAETTSVAEIATPLAARYLTQLCKHFQHKCPVTVDGTSGHIAFGIGDCRLQAENGVLILSLHATDRAALAELRDVTARHLMRFAFREAPTIAWRPIAAPGSYLESLRRRSS